MAEERAIYETDGLESYVKFQQEHENEPLKKGLAFALMKALEAVNLRLHELYPGSDEVFDVVLMTNNHAQVGVRLINSINHYGIAAATLCHLDKDAQLSEQQLRVAFDGDSFVTQESNEKPSKNYLMVDSPSDYESMQQTGRGGAPEPGKGPLVGFLEAIGKIQKGFYAKNQRMDCPIRVYLIIKKGGSAVGLKALKTIRSWGLDVDEAFILSGLSATVLLNKICPHIYLDEQSLHPCNETSGMQSKTR